MLSDLPTAPWFRRVLVAGLILGVVLLTFSVLRPFLVPLIWGAILAYVAWPLHQRTLHLVGYGDEDSAEEPAGAEPSGAKSAKSEPAGAAAQ